MALSNKRKSVVLLVALFVVLTMVFSASVFGKNANAYGESFTLRTLEEVREFLTELNQGAYYADSIYIGESTPIDCSGLTHSPIDVSSLKDRHPNVCASIYFNTQLKNIKYDDNYYSNYSCDNSPHHGLFTKVEYCDYISVYYRVTFNVGTGTTASAPKYYRYGVGLSLPEVTPDEGHSFLGWQEEGSDELVTKISYVDWGVKTYNAVYEIEGSVDSGETTDPEEPENDNTPITYQIEYSDILSTSGVDSLETVYTVGESLELGLLETEGFDFKGWSANGEMVERLDSELQEGLLSEDGTIYLNAVWELNKPSIGSFNGISKTYDAQTSTLTCTVEHGVIGELSFEYRWYEKDSVEAVGTGSALSFCDVVEGEYKLKVTATHDSSGLSSTVESEYVSVTISKRELSISKLDGDYNLSKTYDTTTIFEGAIEKGVHYEVNGVVGGDDVTIQNQTAVYSSAQAGSVELIVTFSGLSGERATNYKFSDATLSFATSISAKTIGLQKLSAPNLSKEYDGTTAVGYDFELGVDFAFEGELEGIEYTATASFVSKLAGETKVELNVQIQNDNYVLEDERLEYDAIISKRALNAEKLSNPIISKAYDGTKLVGHSFQYGVDYVLDGAVEGEIKTVGYSAIYDNVNVIASKVVLVVGNVEFNEGASIDNYDYTPYSMDLYYDASITPCTITVSGNDVVRAYEDAEKLVETISTGVLTETVKVRYLRESGSTVGEYSYVGAEFVAPVNSNYALAFVEDGKVYKIIPSIPNVVFPTFIARDFDEKVTLMDEVLTDGESYLKEGGEYLHKMGAFSWTEPTMVANANNEVGYDMVFTPNDTINYDYTEVDGYDESTKKVTRKVVITINKATPVPTPSENTFTMPIGMRYNKLDIGERWSIVESDELTSSSVASGEENSTATFQNALVYEHDDSGNYNKIYKDLVVNFVLPNVVFVSGENSVQGNPIVVIRNLNGSITLQIALLNPFAKEGYRVSAWTLSDGTKIYPNGMSEQVYDLTNPDLVELSVNIEVSMVARDDIKVEFRHYYENLSGSYDDENMVSVEIAGTADSTRGLSYADLKDKQGFSFNKATLQGCDESIENFTVSSKGDSVIAFYYARKTTVINYVDELYSALPREGDLPKGATVKYGVPFTIERPTNYIVYGYNFVGYTDGVTMENGELKIFKELEYVVTAEVESITFTLRLSPDVNTLYLINRYVDDDCVTEKHYGVTGENVDITNVEYVGHKRYAHENEKLKGTISGNVLDEEGNVLKGEVLTLSVYYKVESFILTLPEEVDDGFMVAEFGEEILLPGAPEAKEDKVFLGWVINGVLYSAGESFVMPATDVVITAKWQEITVDTENDSNSENGSNGNQSTSNDDETTTNDSGLTSGAIIGIVGGATLFIVIIAIITGVASRRQKKREELIDKLQEVNKNMF